LISDAEVIKVVSELLSEFSTSLANHSILINHSKLISCILSGCGIADNLHSKIYHMFSQLTGGKATWSQIRRQLIQDEKVNENSITSLGNFVNMKCSSDQKLVRYEELLKKK